MKKRSLMQRLLGAPYILWAAIFIIVPLIIVVYYSFTDSAGNFTLDNIKGLAGYKDIFLISIEYSLIATVITLLISYPFAYIMSRKKESTQRIMMMLVMLPMWMNLLIRTYSMLAILDDGGFVNRLITSLGLPEIHFIGTPGAVIFGMVYNFFPYMLLPIYTSMSKMDVRLIEAAQDLGCNSVNVFKRVILPLSVPGIISGFTMVFVPAVSTFYISQKLGSSGTTLIGDVIESQFKTAYNPNLGAALSLILMVMIFICIGVMNRFGDEEEEVVTL